MAEAIEAQKPNRLPNEFVQLNSTILAIDALTRLCVEGADHEMVFFLLHRFNDELQEQAADLEAALSA